MKAKLLLGLLTISSSLMNAEEKSVLINNTRQTGDRTETPTVNYDSDNNSLNIRLKSKESFIAKVKNQYNETECCFGVQSSGIKHDYPLPLLEEGVYTIILDSKGNEFIGYFETSY